MVWTVVMRDGTSSPVSAALWNVNAAKASKLFVRADQSTRSGMDTPAGRAHRPCRTATVRASGPWTPRRPAARCERRNEAPHHVDGAGDDRGGGISHRQGDDDETRHGRRSEKARIANLRSCMRIA